MDKRNEIKGLSDVICEELLDMDPVKIIFERNKLFATSTVRAVSVPQEKTVYVDPSLEVNPGTVFVLGHELRHIYQYLYMDDVDFDKHKQSDKLSVEEYNMQFEELDANAFGVIAMKEIAGCEPVWPPTFSEKNISLIKNRVKEILKEEFE